MSTWAAGKKALAICDICGQTCKYKDLKRNVLAQRWTGLLVCNDCNDKDHPQLMLGKFPIYDPISLENARPDWPNTEGAAGWNPLTFVSYTFTLGQVFAYNFYENNVETGLSEGVVNPIMAVGNFQYSLGQVTVRT